MIPLNKQHTTLLLFSFYCIILLLARAYITKNLHYFFLLWNSTLAGIPYLIMIYLKTNKALQKNYFIFLLYFTWLVFLPNSFYIVTDFIHLHSGRKSLFWFDMILLSSFTILGFVLGIISLSDFGKIMPQKKYIKTSIIPLICFLCGFGIYLGRIERYNSWDIINNPVKLITDLLVLCCSPNVLMFSLLLGSFIYIIYLTKEYLTSA